MQETQGVATHLLYQLYVTLEKKKKAQISGTVMEVMQPAANAGLNKKEHEIYSDVSVCIDVLEPNRSGIFGPSPDIYIRE